MGVPVTPKRKVRDPLREVTAAAQRARGYITQRDYAIRVAHQHGRSLREIAEAAGVSHTTVANILRDN